MQALFLLSVYFVQEGMFLRGAFAFSTLLNFKHIYLYAAIGFVAYLLKEYVLKGEGVGEKIARLGRLGVVTLLPFVVSFLPFVVIGGFKQIEQILSRLFPFERGLIHDYWAPNFWAIYYFIDKLANILFARFLPSSNISFR
jgi:alpha-1,3-glucosyltransferase